MNKSFLKYFIAITTGFLVSFDAPAKEPIRVALGYAPVISSELSDPFPSYFQKISQLTQQPFSIRIFPVKRSRWMLEQGHADFQSPYISNPRIKNKKLGFKVSTATLWQVNFVLYSHKDIDLATADLSRLKIVTDRAWLDIMGIPVKPTSDIIAALKMVNTGRLDGVIYANTVTDPIIKELELANIHRSLYGTFDVKALIAINEKTDYIDKLITKGTKQLLNSPELKILATDASTFDDWQVYEMLR